MKEDMVWLTSSNPPVPSIVICCCCCGFERGCEADTGWCERGRGCRTEFPFGIPFVGAVTG